MYRHCPRPRRRRPAGARRPRIAAMRVLLTGASGFVGRRAAARLLADGHRLRLLLRDPARLPAELAGAGGVEVVVGSLERPPAGLGAGIEAVVHLAGLVDARRPRDFDRVNVEGSRRLATAVAAAAAGARWLQVSSLAATGPGTAVADEDPPRPVSRYGASKLAGEEAVAAAGFPERIVLRPPAVYGPGDRAFLPFFQAVARGRPLLLPAPGPAALSLIHVDDLAAALAAALAAPAAAVAGQNFHVAGPERPSPTELLAAIGEAVGRPPRPRPVPAVLAWTAAAAVTPLHRLCGRPAFLSLDKMRELTAAAWVCRAERFAARTGWRPAFPLAAGLADTARSYRAAGLLPPASGLDAGGGGG
ncbi:MAG: NAD(P)-dependent oxidoreductase [Planctomycetota bacterium]|nr:MAG: NAD(P)-dependent oxidoreductase [Planctomycetota bacterium]